MTEVLRGYIDIGCGDAFDFSNCARNMALEAMGVKPPTMRSTGTTIVAVTYKAFGFISFYLSYDSENRDNWNKLKMMIWLFTYIHGMLQFFRVA